MFNVNAAALHENWGVSVTINFYEWVGLRRSAACSVVRTYVIEDL